MIDKRKRWLFWLTFGVAALAVVFLATAMATEYWVKAYPEKDVDEDTQEGANNVTGNDHNKFRGYVHFGLFGGQQTLDHGLGERTGSLSFTDVEDDGLWNFGLWLCTVIFTCLAMVWGLVSMGFAALNASTKPIETITGPMGLYVWNSMAALFTLLAIIMYVSLFYTDLTHNVLGYEERVVYLWSSDGLANLDYSFYFLVVAMILYTLNLLIVALSGIEWQTVHYGHNMNHKPADGAIEY